MAARLPVPHAALPPDRGTLRALADQAFSRAAGAPLIAGNHVRVLRDASENYPAWEQAIRDARSSVHIEMYIFHRDAVGRRFVQLLAEKARSGVAVRVLYDWFGCGLGPLLGLFGPLIAAGGEVRAFNPPRFVIALGWIRRNHRKLVTVDGQVAFISGLCIGQQWEGRPAKKLEPWRDTGVEIRGPAVAHAERAFAESWRFCGGGDLRALALPEEMPGAAAGPVSLRIITTEPFSAALFRTDLLVTAMARRTLWIADAYFIGHGPFVAQLQQAAADGVDVRLLMPQGSDVGWTVPLSRTLYRTLLDSGIRVFEWNGTMMHAKTAVADGRWTRIGSTNLNINSWLGNWELDVAIEDESVARTMEDCYEADLEQSTEIVMEGRRPRLARPPRGRARRSARRALRTVTGLSHSVSAAVTGNRQLESWESTPLLILGALLAAQGALAIWKPAWLGWPLAVVMGWIGLSFMIEALGLLRKRTKP
jgi:cardiolipin synthase